MIDAIEYNATIKVRKLNTQQQKCILKTVLRE